MTILDRYDPITLNHWLWFKYRCHEGSATEFQQLFENIMKRAKPEFTQIRPYGNIGDRKCDGLFEAGSTIFQVYSPDELKQAELQKKIEEDLNGAVQHWGEVLQTWIFVYNARRGLPPDIPRITLREKQEQYPNITIKSLSSDDLWEIARGLSLQQRAEILGAPSGYEHLFLSPTTTPKETQEYLDKAWFVIIQDTLSPISIHAVVQALEPDLPFGAPIFVRPEVNGQSWDEAAAYQRQSIMETINHSRDVGQPRFAVFSLAPIPLVIYLGFLLSDRVQVRCFQFDRNQASWSWSNIPTSEIDSNIQVTGLPNEVINHEVEVVIRVSLSASISLSETEEVIPDAAAEIDIFVEQPNVMWLSNPQQLSQLGQVFRQTLANIRRFFPQCRQIHLFYAGPTGGGVILGQQINPRMNPPVKLYQYSRQTTPRYQLALTLLESGA
jgi:hypothetical protein